VVDGVYACDCIEARVIEWEGLAGVALLKSDLCAHPVRLGHTVGGVDTLFVDIHPCDVAAGCVSHENGRATRATSHIENIRARSQVKKAKEAAKLIGGHPAKLPYILAIRLLSHLSEDILIKISVG